MMHWSDKEYNPINQIVGYLISGDPAHSSSQQRTQSGPEKGAR